MLDAKRRRLQVDAEGGYIAAILHDIALLEDHAGDLARSFEENGAALAREYAFERGLSAGRADTIARSILLHAGHAGGQNPDVQFVMHGAKQDVFGPSPEELPDGLLQALEHEVPRLGFRSQFVALLGNHVERSQRPTWTEAFVAHPPPDFMENRWSEWRPDAVQPPWRGHCAR